jgi:tetratricopeptide (TPR) repeat protein
MNRVLPALALAIAMVIPDRASAQDDASVQIQKARELQERGDKQYEAQDYAGALESYRQSYVHVRRPLRLLGMAQCYRQLKRWAEALKHYRSYLEEWKQQNPDKEPPYLEEVRGHIATLEKTTDEERRQKEAAQRRAEEPGVGGAAASQPYLVPADDGARRRKTVIGYTALGIAGALVVTAGVLYGVGLSSRSSAHSDYLAATDQGVMNDRWADVESAQNKITAGHVLIGLGAVALGFSLYELLTRPRAEQRKVELLPGRLGAALRTTF